MNMYLIEEGTPLGKLLELLGKKNLPGVARAVRLAANYALREWVKEVEKANSKKGWKRKYIDAITLGPGDNPMEAIVSAKGMMVNLVEKGVKRFDMKPGILNGPMARINKKGEPYNIIFMRRGTPGAASIPAMSKKTYEEAKDIDDGDVKKRYRVKGVSGKTPLFSGKALKSRVYTEGAGKLRKKGIHKGMVKVGSVGHTGYGVFRVVTSRSKGWINPGVPAAPVFDKLVARIEPEVQKKLKAGLMLDINEGINFLQKEGF